MADGIFTTDNVDSRTLYKLYLKAVEEYNKKKTPISQFSFQTTKDTLSVYQRSMEFAREGEGMTPEMQRTLKAERTIGLDDWSLGHGFTRKAIMDSEVAEVDEAHREALRADQRLLEKLFFKGAMTEGTSGFWCPNVDAIVPPAFKGNTFDATIASGLYVGGKDLTVAGTISLELLAEMKRRIRSHGYVSNLALFVNSSSVKDIEVLRGWTGFGEVKQSIDDISKLGVTDGLKLEGWNIITDDWVPAGYIVGMVFGEVKPMLMREPTNAKARGLKLYRGPYTDYPLVEAYYERRCNLMVAHRGAGCAVQLAENGYVTPDFGL
jgi:hypothetical protein